MRFLRSLTRAERHQRAFLRRRVRVKRTFTVVLTDDVMQRIASKPEAYIRYMERHGFFVAPVRSVP